MNVLIFLLINMSPSIKWSYLAPDGGWVCVSPAIADIDPVSPGSEIIFATGGCPIPPSHVYCLSSNGNLLWSFNTEDDIYSSPIIANLGIPGDPAIIITDLNAKIYCLNNDGTFRWSFSGIGSSVCSSTIVANIDTIGPPEIIISSDSFIYCLNNDGTEKWKVSLPNIHPGNSPAVANIDKLGTPEILFSTVDSLYCLNGDGTIGWTSYHDSTFIQPCCGISPSIGDVDMDGDPEVVFGDWCFEANGTLKWHYGLFSIAGFPAHSTSAIADVDGDDTTEVVTYYQSMFPPSFLGSLYVFRDNGTPVPTVVWTAEAIDESGTTGATPIICDMDGDGDKDVLWQGTHYLRIYDGATGTVLYENTELTTQTCNEHGIAVADVSGDEKIEMVAIYKNKGIALVEDTSWVNCDKNRFSGHLYHITGINPNLSVPNKEPYSWELHNTWLTQICEDPHGIRESEKSEIQTTQLEISPNPFIHSTTIKYQLSTESKVSLEIYDIGGRKVEELVKEIKSPGEHTTHWKTDNISNGIYFCVLKSDKKQLVKKFVVMK